MDKFKKFFIFFFCLCIAFFPLVNSLDINAEETLTLGEVFNFYPGESLSVSGYQNSDIYDSGASLLYYNTNSIDLSQISDYVLPSGYDYSKYSKIVVSTNQNMQDFTLYLLNDNSYFMKVANYCGIISLINQGSTPSSDNIMVISYTANNTVTVSNPTRNFLKNNVSYAYAGYYFTSSTNNWIASNTDLYGLNSSYIDPSWGSFILQDYFEVFAAYRFNETGPHEAIVNMYPNINYSPVGSGSSGGESSSNNLYMDGAKWSFDIPYYSLDQSGAVYGTGSATFSGSLNNFQISNTSDFTLEFLFTTFLSGYRYSWSQDSEREDFSYKYIYSLDVPLSDFYSNGQVQSFNISDIFDNSISVNPTHLGQSVTEDCQIISNSQAINLFNWYTTFTVALKSNNEFSGKCSSMYSYLLRKSKNTDNSMQNNNNPYSGEEGSNSVPDSDIFNPSGSGSTDSASNNSNSTSNIGDYSVVNNNNPQITINNNNNNDNGFTNAIENGDSDGLLSKLLLLLANNQSTTSNGLSEIADTDGYVQVMGSVFTAVPSTWWTTLTVAFVACIGILVVSFVIKIILKFVI